MENMVNVTPLTLGFLVFTIVSGLWTKMWPRYQWCDTAKGSGACEGHDQTRHSRYTAYPPARPQPHSLLLVARVGAAQGLPPLRLELPRATTLAIPPAGCVLFQNQNFIYKLELMYQELGSTLLKHIGMLSEYN